MIISRTPVRLSMGGGGTDLASYYEKHEGFLMAAAINKYVFVSINKRFNPSIRLSYSKTEIVEHVDEIEHRIIKEALKSLNITKQIEIVSIADVPANSGLGTSSTFTVSLLNGLHAYKKDYISLEKLAEAACDIEINRLKEPIGKQDQYASAFGGFNAYWFKKDGSVIVEPVNMREEVMAELQSNLFLFYLNSERSASAVLTSQNQKSKDGDQQTLDRLHKIKAIGLETKSLFEKGDIDSFGEILHEHWLTKKGLSDKVSDPKIDEAYETARKHGALGGKVVGAGGGGFLLVYCPREKAKLVAGMKKLGLEPMWFSFEHEGAKIIYYG